MSEQGAPSEIETNDGLPRYVAWPCRSACAEKDQDRVEVKETVSAWFAAVCDGATQSMHSAEAAEVISSNPAELWNDSVLSERVNLLLRRREELMASEFSEPVDETSFLSRALADIVRDKRRQAFQTTLVTVRVTPLIEDRVLLEAKTCGDCALLVFDRRGHLIVSSLTLEDESSPFGHASPITEVLPDHFRGEEPSCTAEIDADAHIILCSDGFYDAFPNPSALLRWLLLNDTDRECALDRLHTQLDHERGDDDISFVWLWPCPIDSPATKPLPAPADIASPRRRLAALADLLRRCAHKIARFWRGLSGGIAW